MRSVLLAHDYLTQRGGAERVALALVRAFPEAPVVTSVYNRGTTYPEFAGVTLRTSWLQDIPGIRRDPRLALPLLPKVWEGLRADSSVDVVICSSSGWAHGIPVSEHTKKIVYCHNPPRWLYQSDEYLSGTGALSRLGLAIFKPRLQAWDKRAAGQADVYLANSTVVRDRIRATYGRNAEVLHPPVSIDPAGSREPVHGLSAGYFLTIARGRAYKNTGAIVEAFNHMPNEQLVVLGSTSIRSESNVTYLSRVQDAQLRWLYANAKALIAVSYEDFGLTPIEANAFGVPVVALRAGGFLDTTVEGVSGLFIEDPSPESIKAAVLSLPEAWDRDVVKANAERFSEAHFASRLRDIVLNV